MARGVRERWMLLDVDGAYRELNRQAHAFADIWAKCDEWCARAEGEMSDADLARLTRGYCRKYGVSATGIVVLCNSHYRMRMRGAVKDEAPPWVPLGPQDVRYAARGEVVYRKRRYYAERVERAARDKRFNTIGGCFRREGDDKWGVILRGYWEPWTKPRFREMGEESAWIDKGVITTNKRMLALLSERTGKSVSGLERNMQIAQRKIDWPKYAFRINHRLVKARVNAQSERGAERILSSLSLGAPIRELRKVI